VSWGWAAAGVGLAVAHIALIVLLVVGGPASLRWPFVRRIHLPALVATAAVFGAGADCPLTVWQKVCIKRSGASPYDGGFIEHHFIQPVTGGGATPLTTLVTVTAWAAPTAWSYASLMRRNARGSV
jgi:hypothetical protein